MSIYIYIYIYSHLSARLIDFSKTIKYDIIILPKIISWKNDFWCKFLCWTISISRFSNIKITLFLEINIYFIWKTKRNWGQTTFLMSAHWMHPLIYIYVCVYIYIYIYIYNELLWLEIPAIYIYDISMVAGSISSGTDHGIHCWWEQVSSDSVCHTHCLSDFHFWK